MVKGEKLYPSDAAFDELNKLGLVTKWNDRREKLGDNGEDNSSGFFVRRLLHLQHICQRYSAEILEKEMVVEVTRRLMTMLHPTPAVCGVPMRGARGFIRKYESVGVDRGFYSGPFGYIGSRGSDIVVAIRSGLATTMSPSGTEAMQMGQSFTPAFAAASRGPFFCVGSSAGAATASTGANGSK